MFPHTLVKSIGFGLGLWLISSLAYALNVVVTIQPIHALTCEIMAGVATPHRLLSPGTSPHFFSLKPSDRRRLASADLIIWVGPELEQVLTQPMKSIDNQLNLMALMSDQLLDYRKQGTTADPAHKHQHVHDHDHHHMHEHAHDHHHAIDPHIWLNPRHAVKIATLIAAQLIKQDPKNRAIYAENAATLIEKLDTLQQELEQQLAPVRDKPYLVYHDAYQYFEQAFGLQPPVVVNDNPHVPLSAKKIRTLQKLIQEKNIECVFTEPEFSNKFIHALDQANIRHEMLDPLGAKQPIGIETYFLTLRALAQQFRACTDNEYKDP